MRIVWRSAISSASSRQKRWKVGAALVGRVAAPAQLAHHLVVRAREHRVHERRVRDQRRRRGRVGTSSRPGSTRSGASRISSRASGAGKRGAASTSSSRVDAGWRGRAGSSRASTARGIVVSGSTAVSASPATLSRSSGGRRRRVAWIERAEQVGQRLPVRVGDIDGGRSDRRTRPCRAARARARRSGRPGVEPARGRGRRAARSRRASRRGADRRAPRRGRVTRISVARVPPPVAAASTRTVPGAVGLEAPERDRRPVAAGDDAARARRRAGRARLRASRGLPAARAPRGRAASVPSSIPVTTSGDRLGGRQVPADPPAGRVSAVNDGAEQRDPAGGSRRRIPASVRSVCGSPSRPKAGASRRRRATSSSGSMWRATIRLLAARPSRARRRRRFASSTSPACSQAERISASWFSRTMRAPSAAAARWRGSVFRSRTHRGPPFGVAGRSGEAGVGQPGVPAAVERHVDDRIVAARAADDLAGARELLVALDRGAGVRPDGRAPPASARRPAAARWRRRPPPRACPGADASTTRPAAAGGSVPRRRRTVCSKLPASP